MSAATIDHFAEQIEAALGATPRTAPVLDHFASLDAASARHGAREPAHAPLAAWGSSPAPLRAAHAATQTRPTQNSDGRPVVTTNGRPVVAGRK